MRSAAVQAGLVDRAAVGVGPVDAVGVDRHPDRAVLAADDGTRAGTVKVRTIDRAVPAAAVVGPVQKAAGGPPTVTPVGKSCPVTMACALLPSRLASQTVPARGLVQYKWLASPATPHGSLWSLTMAWGLVPSRLAS
jgi:hypothetical protein